MATYHSLEDRCRDHSGGAFPPEDGYLDPSLEYRLTQTGDKFKEGIGDGATFRVSKIKHSHISGMPMYSILVTDDGEVYRQRLNFDWVENGPVEIEPID